MVKIGLIRSEKSGKHVVCLTNGEEDTFVYSYSIQDDIVQITIQHYEGMEDSFHDIAFLTEWHTKRLHPNKICMDAPNELRKIVCANGYYPKGKYYQKILDKERLVLKDSVFDEEGYIIDQGSMSSIPFGWFDTARKGCGWIAAYNLLKANGKQENMADVRYELEQHGFLGKVFGQEVMWLILYLKSKGLSVNLSMPGIDGCIKACKTCDTGILAYMHAQGAHYAMFSSLHNGQVHFYNAKYKRRNHIESMETFLKQNTIFHGCLIITCRKKAL